MLLAQRAPAMARLLGPADARLRCISCGHFISPVQTQRRSRTVLAVDTNSADNASAGNATRLALESANRPWVWREPCAQGAPRGSFTVMSYNILADHLARRHTQLYPHCSEDILEVSCFSDVLEPVLAREGYVGRFKKRTGDQHLDGCAMFVNTAKFEIGEYTDIEFRVPGDQVLKGDNVAQVAVLKSKDTGRLLTVANTHILYAPARGDVKLLQLKRLFKTVSKMREAEGAASPPAVICGDFNSTPGSMLVTDFVLKGSLSFVHIVGTNRRKLSGQLPASSFQDVTHIINSGYDYGKCPDLAKDGTGNDPQDLLVRLRSVDDPPEEFVEPSRENVTVKHPLALSSAYDYRSDSTTYHKGFKGVVDYVLYTRDNIKLEGIVQLIPATEFRKHGGMPNAVHPSDHQPLLACFSLGSGTGDVRSLR